MENTNALALIVDKDELLRKHCAVEVVTKIDPDQENPGYCRVTTIIPKIEGTVEDPAFTYNDYFVSQQKYSPFEGTPQEYGNYSSEEIENKYKKLFDVHVRLFENGYMHVHNSMENTVFNPATQEFVLVDWQLSEPIKKIVERYSDFGPDSSLQGQKWHETVVLRLQRLLNHAIEQGESTETLAAKFEVDEQSISNVLNYKRRFFDDGY